MKRKERGTIKWKENTMKMKNNLGFNIMELLIVIAAIGIIAGIAYPSYTNHIIKTKRIGGFTDLQNILLKAEQYAAQNNNAYPTTIAELFPSNPPSSPDYTFSICECSSTNSCKSVTQTNCIQARAVRKGNWETNTKCANLTMSTVGDRKVFGTGGADNTSTCYGNY